MISCRPKGIFSRKFLMEGDGQAATLEFKSMSEQGRALIGRDVYDIRKHGAFSGHWTLDRDGEQQASAKKASAFKRAYEVSCDGGEFLLKPNSAFKRGFCLEREGEVVAEITPNNAFTRKAKIEMLAFNIEFPIIAFSFWLVALSWHRSQQNNS